MKHKLHLWILSNLISVIGCSASLQEAALTTFELRCLVKNGQSQPLADAKLTVQNRSIGTTDALGNLSVVLSGREGQEIPISFECPKGYHGVSLPNSVKLTKTRGLGESESRPWTMIEAICESDKRDVIVIVQSNGVSGLPIRVGTQSVGVTDAQGNAQVLVRIDREHTGIEVGIDTETQPELLPKNPSRTFSIGHNDSIIVYTEKLAKKTSKVKMRVVKRIKKEETTYRPLPIRLD